MQHRVITLGVVNINGIEYPDVPFDLVVRVNIDNWYTVYGPVQKGPRHYYREAIAYLQRNDVPGFTNRWVCFAELEVLDKLGSGQSLEDFVNPANYRKYMGNGIYHDPVEGDQEVKNRPIHFLGAAPFTPASEMNPWLIGDFEFYETWPSVLTDFGNRDFPGAIGNAPLSLVAEVVNETESKDG